MTEQPVMKFSVTYEDPQPEIHYCLDCAHMQDYGTTPCCSNPRGCGTHAISMPCHFVRDKYPDTCPGYRARLLVRLRAWWRGKV
jgi:hypothetical protein